MSDPSPKFPPTSTDHTTISGTIFPKVRWATLRASGWSFLIACVFAILTVRGWRKWPDIMIDCGHQLYVPWELSLGKVLYRDVAYIAGGPFSSYFHALLFRCFGVSLTTIMVANLCLLAAFIALLQYLLVRATDWLTASLSSVIVLSTFAFAQLGTDGSFNFICPYSYDATHGLMLSVATLACLWRWLSSGRDAWTLPAGFGLGCVLLTKPDVFLALSAALAVALIVHAVSSSLRQTIKPVLLLFTGLMVPAAVVIAYYAIVWQATAGFKAIIAGWLPMWNTGLANNQYYQWCLGLDHPVERLTQMGCHTLFLLLGVVLSAWFARTRRTQSAFWALGFSLVALLYVAATWPKWYSCGDVLLPVTCGGLAFVAWRWWQGRHTPEGRSWVFPLLWSVFALSLMAKMGFHTRLWHYGFYQALPAAVFLVLLATWWLPRELARFRVHPATFRALMLLFLGVAIWRLAVRSDNFNRQKLLPVGGGADRMLTMTADFNPKGTAVNSILDWLNSHTSPTNTLAVLPDGVMLNFLTRRINPTPYTVVSPQEIQVFGGSNIAAAYAKHPPDDIILIKRPMDEFGYGNFGDQPESGRELFLWVCAHYTPVYAYPNNVGQTESPPFLVLRRNDLTLTTP